MAPDLEIPIFFLLTSGLRDRLILHSPLGAATVGASISVLLTVFLFPPVVSFVFKLDRKRVEEKCRFPVALALSSVIGDLSHVFLDSMTHKFNPVFYPFIKESFDTLERTNYWAPPALVVDFGLLVPLIFFPLNEIRKGAGDFWMRVLVG